MPTPQSPNSKPVNNTGKTYVHPDHGLVASITEGVSNFVKSGGLLGNPAPKPAAPASDEKKTGKIVITGRTLPAQKPMQRPSGNAFGPAGKNA